MKKPVLVAALLFTACTQQRPSAFPHSTADVAAAVGRARARWFAATGVEVKPWRLHVVHGAFMCGKVIASGCFRYSTRELTIRNDLSTAVLDRVALHEAGHAFGARHTKPGSKGCMLGGAAPIENRISKEDLAAACDVLGCKRRNEEL